MPRPETETSEWVYLLMTAVGQVRMIKERRKGDGTEEEEGGRKGGSSV